MLQVSKILSVLPKVGVVCSGGVYGDQEGQASGSSRGGEDPCVDLSDSGSVHVCTGTNAHQRTKSGYQRKASAEALPLLQGGLELQAAIKAIAQPPYTRWKLPDGLGEITTIKHPDMPFPSIYAIWGKGYGSQMVKALVSHYGGLTSDPTGNTSGDAQRMWERLGAEQVPSKNPNGFYYLLRA